MLFTCNSYHIVHIYLTFLKSVHALYTSIESFCCASEANIMLYLNYI